MTRRQSEVELAEALVPTNHVRLLWYSSVSGLSQLTGEITAVTGEVVHLLPHQNAAGRTRAINRERIHSAVVTKTGEYTTRRRAQAAEALQAAAILLMAGDIEAASAHVFSAARITPGLLAAA